MSDTVPPSLDTLKERARALVPGLRARAAQTEASRRLPDETLAELRDSGLFRALQPRPVGGSELPFRALIELGAIVSEGCAATGWVLTNLASHHWMLAMWPEEAQDEIWGAAPDGLIGSAFVFPGGKAVAAPGGYRLSGHWPYSSGVDAVGWCFLGAMVTDERGQAAEPRIFLVEARDYAIRDTWFATGLRGTGSKDIEMAETFLPAHRSLKLSALAGGPTPGGARNPAALYELPALGLFAFVVAGVPLGIARGAVADFAAAMRSRVATYSAKRLAEMSGLQLHLAEAAALVDTAEALILADCDEATHITEAGDAMTLLQKARWRRDGAYAAGLCTKAVDILLTASGGGGIYLDRPIQRSFRDIHTANAHHALNWDANATLYGRVALGLPADTAGL